MLVETRSIGEEIDRLFEVREKIREAEDQAKAHRAVYDAMEANLLQRLKDEGMTKATGGKASIAISESIVPQVEDWDAFYKYIGRNKAFHLLERRPSAGAYRELMAQRTKPLPGVVPFTKQKLSLRTV